MSSSLSPSSFRGFWPEASSTIAPLRPCELDQDYVGATDRVGRGLRRTPARGHLVGVAGTPARGRESSDEGW